MSLFLSSHSPGDRQVMSGLYQVYERGQTHFQIGDNTNIFDWTYVGNVARAHLLAADKLDTPPPETPLAQLEKAPLTVEEAPPLTPAEQELVHYPLRPITVSTGSYRVPTSDARPLGPYVTLPPNAEKIEAAFKGPNDAFSTRPVVRTRFDAFSDLGIMKSKLHNPETTPLQVAGQVFFITNGEPCYFWDFPRIVWHQLDAYFPGHRTPKAVTVLPKTIGLAAAVGSEWYSWLVGKQPTFTKFSVTYSCATRWHNIEKARRVLGYEPEVGLEEGIKRTVDVSLLVFC
jgi:sterol-4alpha-carboxylate 3-dehydrogenase (decarboxylating)